MRDRELTPEELFREVIKMVMDPQIDDIEKEVAEFNFFDTMGIARAEIRHSNALAWLLNPNMSHGLGDSLLRFLVRKAYDYDEKRIGDKIKDILQENYQTVVIRREWRHIDILAECEKIIIAIENKVDSQENGTQLKDYYEELSNNNSKIPLFFLLSPDGREAENEADRDIWIPISYEEIHDAIKNHYNPGLTRSNERVFIESYLNLIRREFMKTKTEKQKDLETIAMSFYNSHTDAIKYLFSLVPDDIVQATKLIREWLQSYSEKKPDLGIIPKKGEETKGYVRFTTQKMDKRIEKTGFNLPSDFKGGWLDKSLYYYEILVRQNQDNEIVIGMQLELSSGDNNEVREKLSEIGKEINDKRSFQRKWIWRSVWSLSDNNKISKKKPRYFSFERLQDDDFDESLGQLVEYMLAQTEGKLRVSESEESETAMGDAE